MADALTRIATTGSEQVVDAVERAGTSGVGNEDALVGLALEALENLAPLHVVGASDGEGDEDGLAGELRGGLGPDRLRVVIVDAFAGCRVVAGGHVAEPDFEVVAELGHRADGRARGLHLSLIHI